MIIELYTRTSPPCAYCNNAKTLLKSKSMEYSEYVVGEDITLERLKEAFPTAKTFPIVTIDNEYIGGFNELKNRLDLGGMSL